MEPEPGFFESYLLNVLKAFVDHPEDIVIERSTDNLGVLLTLRVHKDDMGKVVGKKGAMATQTLRPLLHAVGLKHNARLSLKINEPVGGKREAMDAPREEKSVDQIIDGLEV